MMLLSVAACVFEPDCESRPPLARGCPTVPCCAELLDHTNDAAVGSCLCVCEPDCKARPPLARGAPTVPCCVEIPDRTNDAAVGSR